MSKKSVSQCDTPQVTDTLEQALEYLASGLSVIPIIRSTDPQKDKKPALHSWKEYQHRLPTPDELSEWFGKGSENNIGIVTGKISNLSVIDIDTEEGKKAIQDYLPENASIPTVQTPSGGFHLYFRCPDPPLPNNRKLIPGCDFRGEGGYVVAPPSMGNNGKDYQWTDDLDISSVVPPALPEAYIERVTQAQGPRISINNKSLYSTDDNAEEESQMFSEGRRDQDLFHTANMLVKSGMLEKEIYQVLEKIIVSWGENPDPKWIVTKIESALTRARKREASLAQDVKEFILGSKGVFLSSDVSKSLQLKNREEQKNLSKILGRLCEQGVIERHGNKHGCFRVVDNSCEAIDYLNAPVESLDLRWPFEIERYVKILPKNIAVLAGVSNSGKTAFLLNFIEMNMDRFKIHYFSSEMGPIELKNRLIKFERPLTSWPFYPKERSSNFADVIKPDDINIIDFLEIHKDFWEVGGMIKEIYDKLQNGIAVIALQKDPMKELGRGATGSLEKARLYMTMDNRTLKIVKGKNWAQPLVNPRDRELHFKLIQGCQFVLEEDWHKSEGSPDSGYRQTKAGRGR